MPSPFPGMNPYLEGYLWSDFHSALANKIRQQLAPQLRPRYAVRLEVYVVEDNAPNSEMGILYPDVQVMRSPQPLPPPVSSASHSASATITPAPLTLSISQSIPVKVTNVEIRDTAQNILVTYIEILSPANKREPGLTAYRQKRQRLYQAGVHLVELDLLRRGIRPFTHPQMPDVAYAIALTRAYSPLMEVLPLALPDALPILPIPLKSPDADVALDLPTALQGVYDEAAYELSIDYTDLPPPPALSEGDRDWMAMVLSGEG